MTEFPLKEHQSDHWPLEEHCKCGWTPSGGESLVEHVQEQQMEEIDQSWMSY